MKVVTNPVVIGAYLDEEISLARAASLLALHPLELRGLSSRKWDSPASSLYRKPGETL